VILADIVRPREKILSRVVSEVREINRVVYDDITSKPQGAIESK
jgi:GMP synthase PP-ATPase subunit